MPLSNATQQVLATTPYFDDYYTQNTASGLLEGVDFDFHRILFRPKFGVQARELTQLQTLLQVQLERLGGASFSNGDRVFGGQLTIDLNAVSGQVLANTTLTNFFDRDTNTGKYVFLTTATATKAKITQYVGIDDGETSNNYLVFKYQTADQFVSSGVIQDRDSAATATFASGDVFHTASTISIDEGVCFVSGLFARIRPQTIVLDALSNTPSYRIGLTVDEQILDELDDTVGESLGDPANQGAPGAHRLRVRLSLAKKSLSTAADDNFIELCRVINGVIIAPQANAKLVNMRELEQILARRTYDESGDYMVRQFTATLESDPTANSTNSTNVSEFQLALGAGKAYVRGFEIETATTTRLPINKARDYETVNSSSIAATVGNYVLATRVGGLGSLSARRFYGNTTTVDVHAVPVANIDVSSNANYAYSRIGTTQVRMLEANQVPDTLQIFSSESDYVNDSNFRLFFFNTQFDAVSGTITSATTDPSTTKTTLVISAPQNGLPLVNDALNGVSLVLGGASSGIYTIEDYVTGVSSVSVVLKEYLTTTPTAGTTWRLMYQPRDIDSFAYFNGALDMGSPYTSNLSFQADVAPASKTNRAPNGYTIVSDPNDNSLVYQINEAFIVPGSLSPDGVTFNAWLTSSNTVTTTGVSNTTVVLTFDDLQTYLNLPTGTNVSAATAAENFIIFDVTDDTAGRGRIIYFSDSANSTTRCADTVVITDTQLSFTYRHGTNIGSARTLMAFGKGQMQGVPPRVKDYYIGNTTAVLSGTTGALYAGQVEYYAPNTSSGFAYSLKTHDVTKLRKVLYKSSNTAFSNTDLTTATDVSAYFTLDDGQRDNTYEYGQAIAGRGLSSVVSSSGRLLFIFDWYNHSGVGYSYIDSYLSTPNQAKGLTYEDIPDYVSPKFGSTINLRYAIDFRPARSNKEFLTSSLIMASSNTSSNSTYLTNESSPRPYLIPASDATWNGGYAFYLSRIDRVLLSHDKSFYVKEGESAVRPGAPVVDSDAIVLYELFVPAYTLVDEAGVPTNVKIRPYDYRRFTMKDLAKVEDRVARLEYYTALSQLERNARNQSILDTDSQERFKNGILVDGFVNGAVGDVARDDWAAAIDTQNQILYPTFRYAGDIDGSEGPLQFLFSRNVENATTTGVTYSGDMATLAYTRDALITQPLATRMISVNPFNVREYRGAIALAPAVDTGKSLAPARVLETGPDQAWVNANFPSYTVWNEWQATYGGTVDVRVGNPRTFAAPNVPNWDPLAHPAGSLTTYTYQDVQTYQTYSRQGTQFNFQSVSSGTQTLGNVTVDSYVIHNIRKRDVAYAATGLKPNTSIYPFFDGKNVQSYVQQANALRLAGIPSADVPNLQMGDTVYVKKAITGTVSIAAGSVSVTGTGTQFDYELTPGQMVQIVKGTDTYLRYISAESSNTSATLTTAAPSLVSVTGATLYTVTPMTIADIAMRDYANSTTSALETQISLKLVRAARDAEIDEIVPYAIQAGSVSPTKLVLDGSNTTNGAILLVSRDVWRSNTSFSTYATVADSTANISYAAVSVTAATIKSGVVRSYNSAAHTLRLDNDAPASSDTDIPAGTIIYFVNGDAAGQSANVVSYNSLTQTVTLDAGTTLSNIVAGATIYSLGALTSDGALPTAGALSTGYPPSALNAAVVTGFAGTAAGVLHLQTDQFPVGTRIFRLVDEPNNNLGSATCRAEGNYTAAGVITVEQPTSISTRIVAPTTKVVSGTETELVATRTDLIDVSYVDPVAQSFLISSSVYPQGVFIESIDLVFGAKPVASDETDITVEIRPMVNGYPSSSTTLPSVSPLGKAIATLRAADVNVSAAPNFDDAAVYTRFTFPSLVNLLPGQEYAIVVRSNSDEYKIYTAQMNETVIGTSNIVGAQPYAGSFFKSQNASTWTAEQSEDMMFRINRAVWSVGQTGRLVLRATPLAANTTYDSVTLYAHDVNFGTLTDMAYEMHIFAMNPTTQDLTGEIATAYPVFSNQTLALPARAMNQGAPGTASNPGTTANTIDLVATFTTDSVDVAPYIDMAKINAVGVRNQINNMPLRAEQFEIVTPGDSYLPGTAYSGTVSQTAGSSTVTGTGTTFTSTLIAGRDVVIGNALVYTVDQIINDLQFTTTIPATQTRSANSYATYANVTLTISASDVGEDAAGYAVVKGGGISNTSGYVASVVLTSNGSGYITSPTITVDPTASAGTDAVIQYRSEDWIDGGNALTRYITKPVTLADGFESRDLKVYFDAVRPLGTNFYVYYRILSATEDTGSLDQKSWRLMEQITPQSTVSVLDAQYLEFEFGTTNNTASDSTSDTTDRFKVYAVKVVMASEDPTVIPSIKNFRAIALDN